MHARYGQGILTVQMHQRPPCYKAICSCGITVYLPIYLARIILGTIVQLYTIIDKNCIAKLQETS